MVTIYRFSKNGFESFEQSSHKNNLLLTLQQEKENGLSIYPEHLRRFIQLSSEQILSNWLDYTCGIFVFLQIPSLKDTHHLLNHLNLTQIKEFSWWSAKIDHNAIAFDPTNNNLWKKGSKHSLQQMLELNLLEAYIPHISLKYIYDVKKINFNHLNNITYQKNKLNY